MRQRRLRDERRIARRIQEQERREMGVGKLMLATILSQI